MKETFVKDITEKSDVCDLFLVKQKSLNKAKNDKYYLSLKLCDVSGEIEARVWDNAERISALFNESDVIRITKGNASTYQKKVQIIIQAAQKAAAGSYDIADFLIASAFPIDGMIKELNDHIKKVKEPHLRRLLEILFHDEVFIDRFSHASAAKAVHHAYIGGLLEHTLSVTRLILLIKENYPELNSDLLIAGALLHDIGKTEELTDGVLFEYTDPGRLIGHLVIGVTMLDKRIEKIDGFPKRLADHLKHMILSHHGIYEWGSPKRPKTIEAMALHYADDIDAKMNMVKIAVESDVSGEGAGWTGYHRLLERYLYRDDFDYGEVQVSPEPAPEKSGAVEKSGEAKKRPDESGSGQFNMFEDEN